MGPLGYNYNILLKANYSDNECEEMLVETQEDKDFVVEDAEVNKRLASRENEMEVEDGTRESVVLFQFSVSLHSWRVEQLYDCFRELKISVQSEL